MSAVQPGRASLFVRLAFVFTMLGVLLCLPLLVQETPYTFVVFMFLAQPCLVVGFVFFTIHVFRDLKRQKLL